jgi:hypothetical protein
MAQVFDIIDNLHQNGDLTRLYKTGIIYPSVYRYYQIEKDKRFMTAKFKYRKSKGDIIKHLCIKHQISMQLIYKASEIMNRTA